MAFVTTKAGVFISRPANISSIFCGEQDLLFFIGSWTVSIRDSGEQNRYSKPNHCVFLTLTKCFLGLNLGRGQAPWRERNRKLNQTRHAVVIQRNADLSPEGLKLKIQILTHEDKIIILKKLPNHSNAALRRFSQFRLMFVCENLELQQVFSAEDNRQLSFYHWNEY